MNEKQVYGAIRDQIKIIAEKSEQAENKDLARMTVCMVKLIDKYFVPNEGIKETLEKQLQLLSKRSVDAANEDITDMANAMESIADWVLGQISQTNL